MDYYTMPLKIRAVVEDLGGQSAKLRSQLWTPYATFDTLTAAKQTLDRLREMIEAIDVEVEGMIAREPV